MSQRLIRFRTRGVGIVQRDGKPVAWSFAQSNRTGNHDIVNLLPKRPTDLLNNVRRQFCAEVGHREQNPLDLEIRIERPLDELDRLQQLTQPFKRIILALQRNQNGFCGGQRINGQQS